jgi:galactose oxidase-like protein
VHASFSSSSRWLRLGWVLLFLATLRTAGAQEPEKPFIEPSETHDKTKLALVEAHPGQSGRWDTLPYTMPINPVHVALMNTGKVLVVSGSGNDPDNKRFLAAVWDPTAGTIRTFRIGWDMFCNGMAVLPNGKPFILGGTIKYDPFLGEPRTAVFDPATEKFTDLPKMRGGRWYPTGTVLGNGSVLVYSGLPDATVAALGGNPLRKVYQHEIEIYSPPYLFNADGTPAKRPALSGVVPSTVAYGASFSVRTPDAKDIRSIVLVRAGAVTHSFDMDQRLVGLSFTTRASALIAKAPANGNLAPPGSYLLFVVNAQGVPSVAKFVVLH